MPHDQTDTICALATGAPPSAIAIVRISGPHVAMLATGLLPGGLPRPREARLSPLLAPDGRRIDQGLVTFFPTPRSYTGEDMLELAVHGGRAIIDELITVLVGTPGVRLAEPGEFTRRAFMAGKLDLTAAEAVADLIDADTPGQRDQALAQLDGGLRRTYEDWRQALLEILALVEVAVDFPDEHDAPQETDAPVLARIERLESKLTAALADQGIGERIRDGFRIALIGAPNAGKSSLLNRLAGRDAAIVTDRPGTTRDVLEVRMKLAGHLVLVSDTAGLRESDDVIEAEGIRRALEAARNADLRILVLDADAGTEPDRSLLRDGDLIIYNKIDLAPAPLPATGEADVSRETLALSARTGEGIGGFLDTVSERIAGRISTAPPPVITRARHRQGIVAALGHLAAAGDALRTGRGAELAAEDLRRAVRELSGLMGGIDVEEVLGAVFAEFCIGK